MKSTIALAVVTTLVGCGSPRRQNHHTATRTTATGDVPQGEIVTDKVKEMNSSKYGRPPTTFRKGSTSKVEAPKAAKTAAGFQVQFASAAQITTPTVYDHKVIVSGGFRSTQLFAYEAQTGKSVWALDLHDDGPSSAACEREVCVVNTESCTIFAIAADSGKLLWSYWLGDPLTSAPTIAGNRVFAAYPAGETSDGKQRPPGATHALAAFELSTGKILWQVWLDGDVMSAPVAVGEFVYVSTFGGTTIKLEQTTGNVRYAMKAKATSAPVVQFSDDGVEQMYYTSGEYWKDELGAYRKQESVIRADHNSPQTKYKAATKNADYIDAKAQSSTDAAKQAKEDDAANGFSGGAPSAAAADFAAESVGVSSVSSMQSFQGSRVLRFADKSVNTMGDEVVATDAETGKKLWTYKLAGDATKQGGFLGTAPLAAGKSVLFGTLDGNVVQLDPASGKRKAEFKVGAPIRSQPVVDGGWIYVGTSDGKLVAIDTKDKSVTGWPTWGGNAQRSGIAPKL
ncbi:MAG TPA: PQQ-binding-like beta-propeller repeat protein [Kofleriaceae bacterium]